jgi:hypothetical protein
MIPTRPTIKDRRFRCLEQAPWAAESKAYFAALATNGVTATQAQRDAYNIFIAAGKREGWLSGIQRMFIPVWGVAAANAVDAILPSRSGTWVGTVTHTGKAATGDGTTGYLDMVLNTTTTGMNDLGFWLAVHQLAGGVGMTRVELPIGGAAGGAQATTAVYADGHYFNSGTTLPHSQPLASTVGLILGYRSTVNRGVVAYNGTIISSHQAAPAEAAYAGAIYGLAVPSAGTPVYHSDRPTALLVAGNSTITPAQSEAIAVRLHTLVTKLRA